MGKLLLGLLVVALSLWGEAKEVETLDGVNGKLLAVHARLGKNEWMEHYGKGQEYLQAMQRIEAVKARIALLRNTTTASALEEVSTLLNEEEQLTKKIIDLEEYKNGPFSRLMLLEALPEFAPINSPFGILPALSYINTLEASSGKIADRFKTLNDALNDLSLKRVLLKTKKRLLGAESNQTDEINNELAQIPLYLTLLHEAKQNYTTKTTNYQKEIERRKEEVTRQIKVQGDDLLFTLAIIVSLFVFNLAVRRALHNFVKDDELLYTANKAVTIFSVFIGVIVILFIYIDNVSYLVTVLGFASAGLAIAMKDWFMSFFGWILIMSGGMIRVGDRIKIAYQGEQVIGDVLDVSPTRITLYEEITYLSYTDHKRAGRVIFVPNNLIFTNLILNYSHAGLKTVWDTVEIVVTFDSDHKKAAHIIREIARKYSKGYTELTRKQFGKLRDRYSVKHTNVEPRVFTFLEPHGIKISMWYLTNSFATLTLKSSISAEIVDELKNEPDITIAYPTQTVSIEQKPKSPLE